MVDGIASSAFVDNWTCGKSRSLSGPVNWWEMEKSGATRRDAALLFPKSRRRRRLLRSQLLLVPSPPLFFFSSLLLSSWDDTVIIRFALSCHVMSMRITR